MRNDTPIQFDEDVRLMIKAQGGDRQAYARLYERYVPVIRRHIARHNRRAESREDLVQEVFTRVWEHRDRYRPGMAVSSYLLGFAKNVHREHQVRTYRETRVEPRDPGQAARSENMGPEVVAQRNDLAEWVRTRLAELPPKQRQALELTYLGGFSSNEVSRLLGCSDRTVRTNCRIGLRKLQTLIQNTRATVTRSSAQTLQSVLRRMRKG